MLKIFPVIIFLTVGGILFLTGCASDPYGYELILTRDPGGNISIDATRDLPDNGSD